MLTKFYSQTTKLVGNIASVVGVSLGIIAFAFTPFAVFAQTNAPVVPNAPGTLSPTSQNSSSSSSSSSSSTGPCGGLTVTPASACDSSSTPIFYLNFTSCLQEFDWAKYTTDLRNGIPSNPYMDKGCVSQPNVVANGTRNITKNGNTVTGVSYNLGPINVNQDQYSKFTTGSSATKTAFGNLPVLGVFNNGAQPAQSLTSYNANGTVNTAKTPVNRADIANIGTIFNNADLTKIYSTGGARTGMPRTPFTGPERFVTQNGQSVFQGGYCKTEAGKLVVRTTFAGPNETGQNLSFPVNPADYGLNAGAPISACSWIDAQVYRDAGLTDNGIVKDNGLQVYQYLFKVPFPADKAQCDSWFPGAFTSFETCSQWFKDRYSKLFTGQATGNALYYSYTYFGGFDDKYTQFVGWVNPDLNGPRKTFTSTDTLATLRTYFQDPEDLLRKACGNDTTSSYSTLLGKINAGDASCNQNTYTTDLKARLEGFVRATDGFSIYTDTTTSQGSSSAPTQQNIVDIAVTNSDFSSLTTALTKAELVNTLNGAGPFTVFAPKNSAFAKLPTATLNDLLNNPAKKQDLINILLDHVVSGNINLNVSGNSVQATTLGNDNVNITLDGNKRPTKVNNENVIQVVQATNGTIYVIDGVLLLD